MSSSSASVAAWSSRFERLLVGTRQDRLAKHLADQDRLAADAETQAAAAAVSSSGTAVSALSASLTEVEDEAETIGRALARETRRRVVAEGPRCLVPCGSLRPELPRSWMLYSASDRMENFENYARIILEKR